MNGALAVRVGDALRRRAPEGNRGGWCAREADSLKVSESTYERWFYGDVEPGGGNLLALFDRYGPEFEAEIRGEPTEPDALALVHRCQETLRRLECKVRGNGD